MTDNEYRLLFSLYDLVGALAERLLGERPEIKVWGTTDDGREGFTTFRAVPTNITWHKGPISDDSPPPPDIKRDVIQVDRTILEQPWQPDECPSHDVTVDKP